MTYGNCEAHDLPTDENGECFLCYDRPSAQREPFRSGLDDAAPAPVHRDTWSVPLYINGQWRRYAVPLEPSPLFLHAPSPGHPWRLSPLPA